MANTSLTSQQVVNRLYGSGDYDYTEQAIANFRNGTPATMYTWQRIMCDNLGVPINYYTEQQALWHTLQSELSLTGSDTAYTVQELLNMAYTGNVPIDNVEGEVDGLGGNNFGLLYLMAIA